jgi:membrane protein YdbS with pleckstrin-like domain
VLPEGFAGKRLTSVIRTFVVLIAAALFAISVYFVPSRFFWSAPTKPQVDARAASN